MDLRKLRKTLENGKKYSAIHIIGHGSAGQILFGNALLTNETIENYKSTLSNIGESLTKKGDILFYGCNIAANDKGEALLKKISNFTKADIAASDDLTGKGGDWELEKKYGIVETKNVQVLDYEHNLANGVTSTNLNVDENHSVTNFKARTNGGYVGAGNRFVITLEKENITNAGTLTADSSNPGTKAKRVKNAFNATTAPAPDWMSSGNNGFVNNSENPLRSYIFLNSKCK